MDILFWKNLSKNIKVKNTTKRYFKQYLYKLEVYAPGCKSIGSDDIATDLNLRISHTRKYAQGSWWNVRLKNILDKADIGWLLSLETTIKEYPEVKIRVEEPNVSFYCDSETMVKSLAKSIDIDYRDYIVGVTGPASDKARELLESDKILVKKKPKYQYRVWLKEKQFSYETRSQIYNYLTQLGDLVKIPTLTVNHLTKDGGWMWGAYFYTNDPGVADCIRLINPDIIKEVSEMAQLEE